MTTPHQDREYYAQLMQEAKEIRDHEAALARIEADKQVEIVRIKKNESWTHQQWKKNLIVGILVMIFLLTGAAVLGYTIVSTHESDRVRIQNLEQVRQETAQKCIEDGNLWVDNNCLIATKPVVN